MSRALVLTLSLLLCSNAFGTTKQKPKSVTTLIDAKWEVTPLVLEASEYLAEENSAFFWDFVESINSLTVPLVDLENDRIRYDAVLREASFLVSPAQSSIMKLALSLHIYSPKVEMYAQMATQVGVPSTACPVAAELGGKLTCSVSELQRLIKSQSESKSTDTFSVDHHYPGSENNTITVVLYGELGTPELVEFHHFLQQQARDGIVDYVLRHYVKERPNKRVRLSGYGVELQIKSTEYKAQDDAQVKGNKSPDGSDEDDEDEEIEGFNFNRLLTLHPDQKENLDKLRLHLLESSSDMAPLKVWQVQDLSVQAAERIMSAPPEEALKVMTNIAQNFPLQAKSLTRTPVSQELKAEMKANQERFAASLNLQPADTALFVNGMFFDLDSVDVITLLEVVRQELRVMEGLHNNGIAEPLLSSLLALDLSPSASTSQDYAVDIRDSAVAWVNDIENDKRYRRWSTSLMELLRPTFPGMLRSVRRNLYNLVVVVDPSKQAAFPLLKLAESFIVHTAPLRIGLVFAVHPDATGLVDAGVALLNCFNFISESTGVASNGLAFITDVYADVKTDRDVTVDDVRGALEAKYPGADVELVMGEDSAYDTGRKLARDFIERSGLRSLPATLLNGVPLASKQLTAEDFEEAVLGEIMNQTPVFQKAVYKGEFTDADNALDYLMALPNVMPRLNDRVLSAANSVYLDMGGTPANTTMSTFRLLPPRDQTATVIAQVVRYMAAKPHQVIATPQVLTHWIVADLGTAEGRELLGGILPQLRSSRGVRAGLLVNPATPADPQHVNRLVLAALEVLPPSEALQFVSRLLGDEALLGEVAAGRKKPSDVEMKGVDLSTADALYLREDWELLALHAHYCARTLNVPAGARAVVTNARLLGPLDEDERFTADDFSLLERFSMNSYGDKVLTALGKQAEEDSTQNSDTLMRAIAFLVARPQSKSRFEIPYKSDEHSVVKLAARSATEPAFNLAVIVDPVSRGAQKVGPIVSALQEVLNAHLRIYLNCVEKNSDMPLKSFYRFVLEPEVTFTADGRLSGGPIARFTNLPAAPLLTQNMQVPENWLVASVTSPYDLDNIRMEEVDSVVHSEFELEHLLLEGHCFETTMGNPPRGLQITLGTEADPVVKDTIVMANLGYFQLKANPGAWVLRLRQGRSADIYDIVSHEGSDTPANSTDIKVLISSLRSHVLKLRVAKKPDKMDADLLTDDPQESGLWNSITSTFGGSKGGGGAAEEREEEKINIFSLASGHLYERFLRIMMLSVLKHTRTPVKFWFLKNYLSPNLKDFLPHMAREYGFEYELVEYKWPRWLHQQTEKQRIIWGYKILFLDVLFPLDVKKIIFVDADQVVRADLKELQDLDLGGAPYGYTPFCESRPEMDGFRFWKQGYWRNHLQGRRYHISALYVVDLKRFRRIAAGDRLRGQYQALSQDPNSLSNLDQDLPNNMIHQVAIKSLPQEWLWCETWCDEASKGKAKTIDLCNNPQTKEAKLSAAVRIVAEWRDYDDEMKRLQGKIDRRHTEEGVDAEPEHNHDPDLQNHQQHTEL